MMMMIVVMVRQIFNFRTRLDEITDKINIINHIIIFQTQTAVLEVIPVAQKTNHVKKAKEIVIMMMSVLET